mmetsp:Transcript_6525/g.9853  ORF Transcript_6525/g.9853 Transcript_6525/m.9853 type:complete len:103 (-) Transcript_6525:215-523(-)
MDKKVDQLIEENPLLIVSKSYCPYCKSTKDLFKSLGAQGKIVEIDQEKNGSAMQQAFANKSGQRTVPMVFIGQKFYGGNSDVQKLHGQNQLVPILKDAGVKK